MASGGIGSGNHIFGELFQMMSGVHLVHVPYRGIGAAYPDLLGGHIQLIFASSISSMQLIQAQRLRALAVTGERRAKALPDLPTVIEAGVPGFVVNQWYGVQVAAGTPRPDGQVPRLATAGLAAGRSVVCRRKSFITAAPGPRRPSRWACRAAARGA